MKKLLLLGFAFIFVLSSLSFAAVRYGVGGSVGTYSIYSQPTLVVNFDDKWNLIFGYKSLGTGDGEEAQNSVLVGGTWYMIKNDTVSAGPSLFYYSNGTNTGGGTKAADYTTTHTILALTAKAALVSFLDLRADVLLYDSVGGKFAGVDVKGYNEILSTFQFSAIFYIL
jgi:hypothetical protein